MDAMELFVRIPNQAVIKQRGSLGYGLFLFPDPHLCCFLLLFFMQLLQSLISDEWWQHTTPHYFHHKTHNMQHTILHLVLSSAEFGRSLHSRPRNCVNVCDHKYVRPLMVRSIIQNLPCRTAGHFFMGF